MIIAGIGCREGCPAEDIVALVERALADLPLASLAAPDFKRHEMGLHEAAERLAVPIVFVSAAALTGAQARCITHSATARRATGFASVAEAAALAGGGTLVLPRIASARATCALVRR